MRIRSVSRLVIATGIITSSCISTHAAEPTLCKSEETAIFACTLRNAKKVAICASPDKAQTYVDYRFGRSSNIELAYSANAEQASRRFHRGELIYVNNSEDTIWFKNGGFVYSIFMPARGGPGLEVSRRGAVVARLECKGGWSAAESKHDTKSPFIEEHGSGELSKFEALWEKQ